MRIVSRINGIYIIYITDSFVGFNEDCSSFFIVNAVFAVVMLCVSCGLISIISKL